MKWAEFVGQYDSKRNTWKEEHMLLEREDAFAAWVGTEDIHYTDSRRMVWACSVKEGEYLVCDDMDANELAAQKVMDKVHALIKPAIGAKLADKICETIVDDAGCLDDAIAANGRGSYLAIDGVEHALSDDWFAYRVR